jgi:hypothetical protein
MGMMLRSYANSTCTLAWYDEQIGDLCRLCDVICNLSGSLYALIISEEAVSNTMYVLTFHHESAGEVGFEQTFRMKSAFTCDLFITPACKKVGSFERLYLGTIASSSSLIDR